MLIFISDSRNKLPQGYNGLVKENNNDATQIISKMNKGQWSVYCKERQGRKC